MKNIGHLLYCLLVMTFAVSCIEERMPAGVQPADVPCVLKPDRSEIPFSAQGEAVLLAVKSQNVSWELTGAPSWLTLSQKSGTGDATVTMTAAENKDVDNSRVAVLQLKSTTAKYEFSKSVTVTQSAASIYLTTSETSLTLAPQAVQKNITISSNVEWEAVSSAEWLALTKTNATTLSLNASENATAGTRTATVTLRRVGTTRALATISVVQSEAGITGSTDTVAFTVDGGTKSVDIETDVAWSATTSEASWLTVTPTSGTGGKVSLGISALANNSAAARSAYVYVKIGTEQKLAIPVSQEGILFNVVGALENVFAADGSTKQKLTVESNTTWSVLSCPEWLTVTPEQAGKGSTEITLQASENNSLNTRSATLRIGIEGLTIYKNITVTQNGVVTDLGDRSLEFGWESSQKELVITVPDSWSAAVSDDWFSLSQSSGVGGETIVVTAKTNDGEEGRTGTITIVSEGRSLKITVIQQGQYLKINSTAGEVGAMGGTVSLSVTTSVGATAVVEYEGAAKDWVTFENDDKGVYTLQVAYNPSVNSRTAQFVVRPTMSGTNSVCSSGVKFNITQSGRALSASVASIVISVAGGESATYTITADSTYTITKPETDDWYTLQQDSASCTFSIVATDNTTGAERNSLLTISLTGLPKDEVHGIDIEILQYDEYNGHEFVDLGLPSGVMWADCNVGATHPHEFGGYYAWGETEEKENYEWSTYKWCNGSYDALTKYCADSSYGTVDGKKYLDLEDDVAHAAWGGSWRMPTAAEFEELRNECSWYWTYENGNDGYRVTSRTNGNSIFLPAAGYRVGAGVNLSGRSGYYWSCSLFDSSCYGAYYLLFYSDYYEMNNYYRCYGRNVRPVHGVVKYSVSVSCNGNGSVAISGNSGTSAMFEDGSTVTVIATPDEGYVFSGWFVDGDFVSSSTEYTFTVSVDVTLVARFYEADLYSGYIVGYEYVDLGLPSGLKWATCNVGANNPEEYGGYYAWGETEEKEAYSWKTHKWCNGSETTMTKYCIHSSYGTVDNKTVLAPEDDVAHVKWGGGWRMPTSEEFKELMDNCIWDYTNNVMLVTAGYWVTSKTNGNRIFLPAPGYRHDTYNSYTGGSGRYWSSSLSDDGCDQACNFGFSSSYWNSSDFRFYGFSVRPVHGEVPIIKYTISVSSDGNGSVSINGNSGTSAKFEARSVAAVVATPDEGCVFNGWYDGDVLVNSNAEYTFIVSGDIALTARFVQTVNYNGHECVDLGLPSGLKWATCNVGATKPEEYGGYYAWGETEEKDDYSWETYKWCNGSETSMTKYCTSSSYGTVDNKTVLDPEDDVAHVKWGGNWRMPTKEELDELCTYCRCDWITQNGVSGYKVTSKTNGNSIFLPAAVYNGSVGFYWSSSLGGFLLFDAIICGLDWNDFCRCDGRSVRPVHGERTVTKYTVSVSSDGNGSVSINGNSGTSAMFEDGSTVTVVATPDEGYVFECWWNPETGEIFSEDAEYAFTVSEDVALTARFDVDLSAYYYIRNGYFTDKYAALNSSTKKIEPKAKGTTDNYLWSFVKNVDGTIRIYNKANGEAAYVENAADDQAVLVGKEYDWTLVETTNGLGNKGIGIVSANGSSAWYTNPTSWSYILTKPYT